MTVKFLEAVCASPFPAKEDPRKDVGDRLVDYTATMEGSRDLFRGGHLFYSAAGMALSSPLADKLSHLFLMAKSALSLPLMWIEGNSLRHSISALAASRHLPANHPDRSVQVARAAKKSFLDIVAVTNAVAQFVLCLDLAKVCVLGATPLRLWDGLECVTAGVWDSFELIGEVFKFRQYTVLSAQAQTAKEKSAWQARATLSKAVVAKDAISVALAAIGAGGALLSVTVLSPAALFGMNACWFGTKVAAALYNSMVIEPHLQDSKQ